MPSIYAADAAEAHAVPAFVCSSCASCSQACTMVPLFLLRLSPSLAHPAVPVSSCAYTNEHNEAPVLLSSNSSSDLAWPDCQCKVSRLTTAKCCCRCRATAGAAAATTTTMIGQSSRVICRHWSCLPLPSTNSMSGARMRAIPYSVTETLIHEERGDDGKRACVRQQQRCSAIVSIARENERERRRKSMRTGGEDRKRLQSEQQHQSL